MIVVSVLLDQDEPEHILQLKNGFFLQVFICIQSVVHGVGGILCKVI